MKTLSLYSKDYKVDISHVDFSKRVKLSSLFVYFQDIAVLHGNNLNLDMKTMEEEHRALWVLARMRVDIERYPVWGEKIILETWPNKPNKIECTRNFLIKDQEGNILVRAISTWVLMDIDTRRLKKADSVWPQDLSYIEQKAIDCRLGGLKAKGELDFLHNRKVGYSDIDVNEHLNNAKYVDFITDCFSIDEHKAYNIDSIEVNYSKEALPGDTIGLYKDMSQIDSNIVYIEGINKENDELIFKTKMKVQAKSD